MNNAATTSTPPPSAFSHYAGLAESSTAATVRQERHSRRTTSAGPRPLHLAAGSIVSSAPASPARTASPVLAADEHALASSPYSPYSPRTPLSPTITGLRNSSSSSRRQSSISYKSSGGHSPSPSQGSFGANRDSMDSLSLGQARSPLAGTTPAFQLGSVGVVRSTSIGAKRARAARAGGPGDETRGASIDAGERAPMTLVEKHAELLHFIAQKESKCLELRSQLAVHEAELLELKKKWERIVNRGFERSQTGGSSLSTTSTSALTPAFLTSKSDSTSINNPSYFPALLPAPNAPSAMVLEGIKEGVQGMSRLFAAGLETISQVNAPPTPTEAKRVLAPEPPAASSPRVGLPSRKTGQGHEQKESQSSTTSAASNGSTASSLLSISTTSSATSASPSESHEGIITPTTNGKRPSADSGLDSDFGAFEEAQMLGARSAAGDDREHILMVRDTGATPTMSPNPDFQRRALKPIDDAEVVDDGFDWDDGWGNLDGDSVKEAGDSLDGSVAQMAEPSSAGSAKAAASPGLANIVITAPAAQQMSSWVGSMGKRWGEIKGSPTFTKNQKRATLLLSDMQQSLVSALIAPTPLSASERSPSQASPADSTSASSSSESPFSSNAPHREPPLSAASRVPARMTRNTGQPELSLLDDSDESFGEEADDTVRLTMSAPVMVPTAAPSKGAREGTANSLPKAKNNLAVASKPPKVEALAEEDEWNW